MWRCCVARKNDSEHVCWSRFTCQRCRRRRLCQTSCVNRSQTRKESLPSTSLHTYQSTLTAVCLLCCWLAEILVLFGAKMTCITEQNESMNKTYANYHSASKAQATYCFQQHVFVSLFIISLLFATNIARKRLQLCGLDEYSTIDWRWCWHQDYVVEFDHSAHHFCGTSWLFWLLRLINTLTYLLTYITASKNAAKDCDRDAAEQMSIKRMCLALCYY